MSTTTARAMGMEAVRERLKIIDDGTAAARALGETTSTARATLGELEEALGSSRGRDGGREDGMSATERLVREAREASEPAERAEAAIATLERDETTLYEAWMTLTTLEMDLRTVRMALERTGGRARGVFDDEEFERVDQARATFEATLWNGVRQGILTGESGAEGLVRALRVVAEQEVLDAEFERDAETFEPEFDPVTNRATNAPPPEPKRWKTRVFAEVSNAVEAKLALIAEGFSGLDDKQSIEQVLEALDESLVSLAEMYDYTIPAFPPEWRVFEIVVAPTFHAGVCDLLVRLSESPNTSNGDMVAAVKWSEHYFVAIQSLGLDIETTDERPNESFENDEDNTESTSPPLPFPVGLSTLIDTYCERMRSTVTEWTANLYQVAKSRPPKPDGHGKLWTSSDLEFFRLITEQMSVATETQSHVFVRQCGRVTGNLIVKYAATVAERLGVKIAPVPARTPSRGAHGPAFHEHREVPFETIVAGVNDSRRCQTLSARVLKMISEALGGKDNVMSDEFEHVTKVFNTVHAEARRMISRRVLDDPGLNEVMNTFYRGGADSPWATGESMTTFLATVEDYLDDTETWLSPEVAESVTETLFEQLIELLFILFTKQATTVASHTVARLEEDERALMESMALRMSRNKALGRIARLNNLRGLICAETADDFVSEYGRLLSNWPDAGLDAVATVLQVRTDIDKSTSRSTLERCRDLCITRLAAMTGQTPSGVRMTAPKEHRRTTSNVSYSGFNARFRQLDR